jgi:hypothetical protein
MVRTAKDWGWSPTSLIRNAKDPRKPHRMDYVVAQACQILEDEKCPKCGVPTWHAYSTDSTIAFHLDEITCHACATKEQAESTETDKDRKFGTTKVVSAEPEDGFDALPDRESFFIRLAEEAKAKQRKRDAEKQNHN